jgi:hypothetical protein
MPTFKKVNLVDYPAYLLKSYSISAKIELAERAVEKKDYAGLKHLLNNMDYIDSVVYDVIDRLDVEAIKLVVDRAKTIDNSWYKDGAYINDKQINDVFNNNDHIINNISDIKGKRVELLKILLVSKAKEHITPKELQKLADVVSKQEFDDFCKDKNIDLSEEKFKSLELSQHELDSMNPVLTLKNETNYTSLDLLLSRTFSDKLSLEQLKTIYLNLYKLDPIAKEMLVYTAALISKDNNLRIMFKEDARSSYAPEQNIIKIDTNFIKETVFNIESVLIHEIGHFIYYQALSNDAMPFSLAPITALVQGYQREYKEYINDPFLDSTLNYKIFFNSTVIQDIAEVIKPVINYEEAARKPIDKAAELLNMDGAEYNKYLFTQEYTEYFKANSYIDLFYLNGQASFKIETNSSATIPDDVFDNVLNIYLNEQDISLENPFIQETREEIIQWATEKLLPSLVSDLQLNPKQIHYLDRVGDYVNRGNHLVGDYNYEQNNEKYVELIVRAMEFKAAGLGKELTDPFQSLEQFHIEHVSPVICGTILSSQVALLQFDIDMTGEVYTCLTN